jgi:UDP:flavonoid glycosyltransferase YjiC (YdhE family)
MARILIAWELGGAFGHLARCLSLAEGLVACGHEVTMALKDIRLPTGQSLAPGITMLSAPLTPMRGAASSPPVNYADVLRVSGFDDAQDLIARLNAWRGIITLARPEVLVADHAPTALMAAYLSEIPHLAIGNGFTIPPAVFPWPSIRAWEPVTEQRLMDSETQLDRITGSAQKALGYKTTVRVRELFSANDILDTYPELDHYGERPYGRYVGPIGSLPHALPVAWQSEGSSKILAYLRPAVSSFAAILQALAQMDADVLCVIPGMSPEAAKRYATRHLRIALAPIALAPLLEQADLALSYGNSGFSTQALLAGVPLGMSPLTVEQAIFAQRVEMQGGGKLLSGRLNATSAKTSLQELLIKPCYRTAAKTFQKRYCLYSPEQTNVQSQSLIERVIRDGWDAYANHETPYRPPACLH